MKKTKSVTKDDSVLAGKIDEAKMEVKRVRAQNEDI